MNTRYLKRGAGSLLLIVATSAAYGQGRNSAPVQSATATTPQLLLMDADIGDDIDDAFAVALLLRSPEVHLLGISSAWGDTVLRARMLDRFLREGGRTDVPVWQGIPGHHAGEAAFTQRAWAEREPDRAHPAAVPQMLSAIAAHPGEVTLLAVGPLTNVAAALDADSTTFRKLKRIVIMGGSIRRGYNDLGYLPARGASIEYNIAMDIPAAKKVFASGVPLYVVPLDSSQHKLDEVKRSLLFTRGTPLTDALALLYLQWSAGTNQATPTMYDAVAAAYAIRPDLCPMTAMHLEVTDDGYTRETAGVPNAQACLASSQEAFFGFYLERLLPATELRHEP